MSRTLDVRPCSFVSSITCDRCSASAQHHDHEIEHFVSIDINAGWGSPLGDGNRVEVDLCHACIAEVLRPWLRISLQSWAKPPLLDGLTTHDESGGSFDGREPGRAADLV